MNRPYIIILLIILLLPGSRAWANTYDPLLLRAQASIFPRIVLLDKQLTNKTPNNIIILTIVSSDNDIDTAHELKEIIETKYNSTLGNMHLEVRTTSYTSFSSESLATAYIVLQGSDSSIKNVTNHAYNNQRIVFSYNYSDFQNDALLSLFVKEKTYIYLNKKAIQLYDIKFSPVFYKLTRLVE